MAPSSSSAWRALQPEHCCLEGPPLPRLYTSCLTLQPLFLTSGAQLGPLTLLGPLRTPDWSALVRYGVAAQAPSLASASWCLGIHRHTPQLPTNPQRTYLKSCGGGVAGSPYRAWECWLRSRAVPETADWRRGAFVLSAPHLLFSTWHTVGT